MNEIPLTDRKRRIMKAGIVFFAVMAFLTFLSNTLNNLALPRIQTESPSKGSIVKQIRMDGRIEGNEVYQYYAPAGLRVLEVYVRTGEQVKKGQKLLTLDTSDIQNQIQNETDRYEKMKIDLAIRRLASGSSLAEYDNAIELAQINLERAQADYDRIQILVETGVEMKEKLQNALRTLVDAQRAYTKALNDRNEAILSSQQQAEKSEMEVQSLLYDMEMQKREIEKLQEQLEACKVTSPFDGIVSSVGCEEGETVNQSQRLFSLLNTAKGYCFSGVLDNDEAGEIKLGDEAVVTLKGLEMQQIPGKVSEIKDSRDDPGQKKEIVLEISSDMLAAGQKGTAEFRRRSAQYEYLVSNSAIGRDNNGFFVYVPEEKKGYLGSEIYARAVRVIIGESDNEKTAVIQGLSRDDRVIMASDKPLADGLRVRYDQ